MADLINEGNSKVEVVDSSSDALAKIIAEINGVERINQSATLLTFKNPNDQLETGNATDDQNGAASSFNGFAVADGVIQVQSGDGSTIPQSNLYIDGKSIISDKTFAIGTTGQKELHFGTNGTQWVKITESGYLDFSKMTIGGSQGTAGQYIRNAGNGTIEWASIDSNNAFGTVTVGATSLDAGSVGDTLTITAGSNITLTPDSSNNTITIAATQPNIFSTIAVSGQDNITIDQASDTLNFAGGSGISITTDASTDTVTITNTGTGGTTEDVFKNIAVSGQATVTADSSTDTLTFVAGSGVAISTDDTTDSITFTADQSRLLSPLGYLSYTDTDGSSTEVPLKNYFINKTFSGSVNGGGSSVGMATRAIRMLESDGSTYNFIIMPANSSGDSLVFTFTQSDGTQLTKDITMAA
tara:strand:- start:3587 stop:4825 length:1239 start_codon:yes stop_codon:yes gene_type:complete